MTMALNNAPWKCSEFDLKFLENTLKIAPFNKASPGATELEPTQ